ncbi:MAG: winged helix-turn-helix transcriptional regulator [Acidobacteriaceae bacterium]|nr:winged helix-turn-helix transcriptional regulator [Acidobacteriaceae bacterium]
MRASASAPQRNAVFRAIADPTRREILDLLRQRRQTVNEIASHFRTSRPAISKHLRSLRSAGLVLDEKQGTATICSLNPGPLQSVNHWLRSYQEFWSSSVKSLKAYLEEDK